MLCHVREGDHASIQSIPVFSGLNIGIEGITLGVKTINVCDSSDHNLLGFLNTDLFKEGLKLLTTIQPATALLSSTMQHLTGYLSKRQKNAKVQDLQVGFDFSKIATRYHLREGSYIVVQLHEENQEIWLWDQWGYQRDSGLVVNKANPKKHIPNNYFIFSISKFEDK